MQPLEIVAAIKSELDRRKLTPFRAARNAGLPENAIRTVLNGHEPKTGRLAEICKSLDLEFYVGPPRETGSGGEPVASQIAEPSDAEREFVARIRETLAARGLSARAAALQSGLPIRAMQGVLEGHSPSLGRAAEICVALGLEFYVGPPRGSGTSDAPSQIPGPDPTHLPAAVHAPMPSEVILEAVRHRLATDSIGVRQLEAKYGLDRYSLHGLLGKRRKVPSVDRAATICAALGLEFYIGPPRGSGTGGAASQIPGPDPTHLPAAFQRDLKRRVRELERHVHALKGAVAAAGGNPTPPELRASASERADGSRQNRRDRPVRETDPFPDDPLSDDDVDNRPPAEVLAVPFAPNVRVAAGSGEPVWDETTEMTVLVARAALAPWARPERLICVRVAGDSMEPTLRTGDLAVLDRGRTEPREGSVFAVRTDDGLVVKRLRNRAGGWRLTSDNPAHRPGAVTAEDRILGQVAWTGPPASDADGRRVVS